MTSEDRTTTEAEESLRKNIESYPSTIRPGDVVIDLVEGRPLFVTGSKGSAIEVFENEAFDLTTYKVHPWLPIGPHDEVFECVFLPTHAGDLPSASKSQTYSYPRGRLARVAVEWLTDSDRHFFFDATVDRLVDLFESAADPSERQVVVDVATGAYNTRIVDDALAEAGFDPARYGADAPDDERPPSEQGTADPPDDEADDGDLGDFDDFEADG